MPCHAMPCHPMPSHSIPSHPVACHTMLFHAVPCHAMLCHAVPCCVMLCQAMPCRAMPSHAMPYAMPYAMPCHAIPCHALPCHPFHPNIGIYIHTWNTNECRIYIEYHRAYSVNMSQLTNMGIGTLIWIPTQTKTIQAARWKLSNQEQFDLVSFDLNLIVW